MREVLNAANSYPDDGCSQLRYALAEHHELPPEQVLVTVGSTEMLSLLCQTTRWR
jgi:histidinol-phosphate/aromatic aminotransferase/cobyric acid decarboxylase-like protein